jgi:hypothetical protein
MATWRFVESEADGHAWMNSPSELHTFIDVQAFAAAGDVGWRRIMVVTKAWVERQLAGSGRTVFSAMLVLPDSSPATLRASIDAAVSAGGLEHFALPVE